MLSTIFTVYAGGAASAGCKKRGAMKNTNAKIAMCPSAETKIAAKYPTRDGCSSPLWSEDATFSAHFAPLVPAAVPSFGISVTIPTFSIPAALIAAIVRITSPYGT